MRIGKTVAPALVGMLSLSLGKQISDMNEAEQGDEQKNEKRFSGKIIST